MIPSKGKNISVNFFTGWSCGINSKKLFIPVDRNKINPEWEFAFHSGLRGLPLQTSWEIYITKNITTVVC